ncbi:hypothetical protein ACRRTK_013632 [Alexandromys fortis]
MYKNNLHSNPFNGGTAPHPALRARGTEQQPQEPSNVGPDRTCRVKGNQSEGQLMLCPLMAAVTYIDEKRDFRTYRLSLLEEYGCFKELASRLRYARTMVDKLLSSRSACNRLK